MRDLWRPGNRVDLLENGEEFFPRVRQLIDAAITSVYIETFILGDDEVGRDLREVLIRAARRNVSVDVLADGFGSDGLSPEFVGGLAEAGARLHLFEPRRRLFGMRTNVFRRMHRKITLIDGRIALLGGINYCKDHLVERGPENLHDFAVEVEGPVVDDIRDFVERSASAPAVKLPRRRWWSFSRARSGAARAPSASAGTARIKFVTRDNHRHTSDIEHEYRLVIRAAREEVLIANAYFFPGYRLLRDLRNAARRGVRVALIVQGKPDMPIVGVGARSLFHFLVPAGVQVYEYCQRPLHDKVAVADGRWSTVGSSNLDPLSLSLNLEANVFIDDRDFHDELRGRLQRLIEQDCRRVTPEHVPPQTLWRSIGNWFVFHILRHFPRWAGWIPAHRPRIASVLPDGR
jgi:cardiolipin synthase A/B